MRRLVTLTAILTLVLVLIGLSWVTVDETQYVLVTEFGRVVAAYGEGQSGLHGKWPWQSALAIDRR
jgi:regulator of protease activity HflC (stomatin/prohibitin superfamily)